MGCLRDEMGQLFRQYVKTCLHLLNRFALMSCPSADADGFIPPLSQHGVDGENSHPNIQSNDPSKLEDTSVEDVNILPNNSSTHDSSVFESNTHPDDHIDSYRRFRLHQEKTYRPNEYGFLWNTEFDFRSNNGYTFVSTYVICDILNDANIKLLALHHFPPTFIQDLMVRTVKKNILVRNKRQLDRVYNLLERESLVSFCNRILDPLLQRFLHHLPYVCVKWISGIRQQNCTFLRYVKLACKVK